MYNDKLCLLFFLITFNSIGEVSCGLVENFSFFILNALGLSFILAIIGYFIKTKNGYEPINKNVNLGKLNKLDLEI